MAEAASNFAGFKPAQTHAIVQRMNVSPHESAVWAATLIQSRRTTLPKRLCGPGPDAQQKRVILEGAAAAPDHDQILPWRFVEIPQACRTALGLVFEDSLLERDPSASEQERLQAREKAERSPWLLLLVVRTGGEPEDIPACERLLSAGAAVQNMLLLASAMGLGSSLTSGKALSSLALRRLFQLPPQEQAVCFVNIGHIREARMDRSRPEVEQYFSRLHGP